MSQAHGGSREAETERRKETEAYKKRHLLPSDISLTVAANHICVT